jgi:hypothetical protein
LRSQEGSGLQGRSVPVSWPWPAPTFRMRCDVQRLQPGAGPHFEDPLARARSEHRVEPGGCEERRRQVQQAALGVGVRCLVAEPPGARGAAALRAQAQRRRGAVRTAEPMVFLSSVVSAVAARVGVAGFMGVRGSARTARRTRTAASGSSANNAMTSAARSSLPLAAVIVSNQASTVSRAAVAAAAGASRRSPRVASRPVVIRPTASSASRPTQAADQLASARVSVGRGERGRVVRWAEGPAARGCAVAGRA